MPTYEYKCKECEHTFEEFQSITSKPLRKCPSCGKNRVKRLIGCGAGVIFKGSGFYETDYRSEGYKEAARKDTASADNAGKDSSAKADTSAKTDSSAKSDSSSAEKPKAKSTEKAKKDASV